MPNIEQMERYVSNIIKIIVRISETIIFTTVSPGLGSVCCGGRQDKTVQI